MKSLITIVLLIISFSLNAAEQLNLSKEENKNLLLKKWTCNWKSPSFPSLIKGKYIFEIQAIENERIAGKFKNTLCPESKEFNGSINKDEIEFELKYKERPCISTKLKAKLLTDKAGELLLKGRYEYDLFQGAQYQERGSLKCK